MNPTSYILQSLSWNITYRCNLNCPHCYLDAGERINWEGELSLEDCKRIIDEIWKANKNACLILTGGEPLLRKDIFDIGRHASSKGLTVFLGTNGTLIDEEMAERILNSGISGVGISIDSLKPEIHDSFRGVNGSWERAVNGLKTLKKIGFSSIIQFSLMEFNKDEIEGMVEFALSLGLRIINIYYLICTGRGDRYSDLSTQGYEETMTKIAGLQKYYGNRMWLNVKCAPSYKRILYEKEPDSPWLKSYRGGCPAGLYYCRVTPEGYVTPCPYMPVICGDLKTKPFKEIWEGSSIFQNLKRGKLKGRCGVCEYSQLCIGCRARAFVESGDYMGEDNLCSYKPIGRGKISTSSDFYVEKGEITLPWSEDAMAILNRIPSFARGMVIKRVEGAARAKGLKEVTSDLLHRMRDKTLSHSLEKKVYPPA